MAKPILGIDIGYDSMKLALVKDKKVRKTVMIPMPAHLIREGRPVSVETMGELLRNSLKENNLRCGQGAMALPNETVFIRNVRTPLMTVDQLNYNLPYEFRDYITEELKNYLFDYAIISINENVKGSDDDDDDEEDAGEDGPGPSMELMAVAAPKSLIDESKEILHKAGVKLVKAAPTVSCFQALIRNCALEDRETREYCILDLGYQSIRMYMFKGDRHMVTRVLEIGMSSLDQVIAESYGVDTHLAHNYLLSNFEDCQNKDYCVNAYGNITVELMRALNFYRFSNPDSRLEDIWICGGGAVIKPLRQSINDTLDMSVHEADELLPHGAEVEQANAFLQAIGITLE